MPKPTTGKLAFSMYPFLSLSLPFNVVDHPTKADWVSPRPTIAELRLLAILLCTFLCILYNIYLSGYLLYVVCSYRFITCSYRCSLHALTGAQIKVDGPC
jgi:hypothetical protein